MKPYLLRNSDQQHEERLALERWYAEDRGHPVDYKDILHELQHQKYLKIRKS